MQQKSKLIVPFAPVERIMKEATSARISTGAVEAMTEELISFGKKIGDKAWKLAQHSGRKTITGKDIKLAYEQMKR